MRFGAGSARAAEDATASEHEGYVEQAENLASRFVRRARERFGAELDYDLDHVRRLDRVLKNARDAFDDEMVLMAGFFFGEVLRRAYDGGYRWHEGREALALDVFGLTTFPIEKVRTVVQTPVGQLAETQTLEAYLMILAKQIAEKRRRGAAGA